MSDTTRDTLDDVEALDRGVPPVEPLGDLGDLDEPRGTAWADVDVEDDGMPPVDLLREAMKAVIDPEIGYNVVDLGLVYDIDKRDEGLVHVTMTLTAMGCPLTELIHQQVTLVLGSLPGVRDIDLEFTFDPPWGPEMMDEEVREELRAMGMPV